jgi:diguanylate cyclase (GGDEF)-like protein
MRDPSPTWTGSVTGSLKVLVVDDEPDIRDVLACAVRALGNTCTTAIDGIEAWETHGKDRADVIISDWNMPRMDGIELCMKVRADDPTLPYTHFIFVSANRAKASSAEGMRAGADDYLGKPIDLEQLETRLTVARRMLLVQRELRARNTALRSDSERAMVAARTDALTTALNRLALTEYLEALAARVSSFGHRYCAALCDVDNFKAYNDCFGHLSGDEALRAIAAAIHGQLRRGDSFYRYGGEEFLAILPEHSLVEARAGIERARIAVERLQIPHAPGTGAPFLTISAGIAVLGAARPSIEDWLRRSDAALYVAKVRGRNRIELETA